MGNVQEIKDGGAAVVVNSAAGDLGQTVTLDTLHYRTEELGRYIVTGDVTAAAAAGIINYNVRCTVAMDLMFNVAASSNCWLFVHEAATISGSGTAMTVGQLNRATSATAGATFYESGTVSGTNAPLYKFYIPAGGGGAGQPASGAGNFAFGGEMVLAATQYTFALVAGSAGDFSVSFAGY